MKTRLDKRSQKPFCIDLECFIKSLKEAVMETIHVVCFKNRISKFFCDNARKQSANRYEIHRKRFAEGL